MRKEEKKALIKNLEERTGEKAVYLGTPTFAYRIGNLIVDRDGNVSGEENEMETENKPENVNELNISVPAADFDVRSYINLISMIYSKQKLLNKALNANFHVTDNAIETLKKEKPDNTDWLMGLLEDLGDEIKGIRFQEDQVVFMGFEGIENAEACATLSGLMVRHAKEHRRIHAKLAEPENEKYAMRIWLNQLGMKGKEKSSMRKAVLKNHTGNAAFRTEESKEKWEKSRRNESV